MRGIEQKKEKGQKRAETPINKRIEEIIVIVDNF